MKKIFFIVCILFFHESMKAQLLQWVKQIGGENIDRALAITTDASGNTYTTGGFIDTVDLNPGNGIANAVGTNYGSSFIVQLDPSGNFLNALTFGGAYYTHVAIGTSIATDTSNNILTAGYFYGDIDFDPDTSSLIISSGGYYSVYITKLSTTGKLLWVRNWIYNKFAGTATEEGPSMALDHAGNVYTAGRFKGTVDFDPGTSVFEMPGKLEDGYISKLDTAGNLLWAKQLATDTTLSRVYPKSISVDAAGNVFIVGIFEGTVDFDPDVTTTHTVTTQSVNGFLLKLDALGNFVWMKRLGNDNDIIFGHYEINAVAANATGNTYVTGSFTGTVDFGSVQLISAGNSDIFIAKTDAAGNFIWAKQFGSINDAEAGSTLTLDASDNVYIAGDYRGTVDFDPGSGVSNLSTRGYTDNFVLKLTSAGDFVWAKGYGGSGNDEHISCIHVKDNSVYTVGKFAKTVNFDSDGNNNLTAAYKGTGAYLPDAFIHKMNQNPTGVRETKKELQVAVYPNPATRQFKVDLDGSGLKDVDVMIYNMQGTLLLKTTVSTTKKEVNVNDLIKGVYLLKIQKGNSFATSKLVIE